MWLVYEHDVVGELARKLQRRGNFYWVMANVTPLMQGDQPSGFM